ncbi:hypothetical protein LR48_Vigan07g118300 [Vigna angularis]|uniref:Uncharacterized protein n=1 Tax=Phaseolus angularis TaxID=3914 RepID=A0A0L9UY74_PHAAN|nr:hypothetical protein LR48_Vigan07g118300 [Vigna angularis]
MFKNMASGPSGPPIPPSGNSDKGKGKKPYVVIPAFTPTPHQVPTSSPTSIGTSLPPLIQVPCLTPTPYQVPPYLQASLSPNVGSNPSTPKNIAASPGIEDADPHSSSAANNMEECSNSRPMITPVGGGFYPTKTASKAITATIKEQFDEPWLTWGAIPKSTRDVFFERFKSQELGRSVHVDEIFQQTHIRQSIGEFMDERSRRTHAAGGKYKGRVYGIGNVTSQDDCVDSYIQQTQASSTAQPQNSEEILNLKSQLQQYGQQLQNLEGFIGVLLPFLPPSAAAAAQQFLNLPNPQVQNDVPNIVQPEQQPPKQQPPEQQPPEQ